MPIPVSLEEAKAHLRIEAGDTELDTEIQGFIDDAAAWVESYTGHILDAREVTQHFTGFRPPALRAWPIAADAAVGIAYADAAGLPASITGARIDASTRPARVIPAVGSFWPFVSASQAYSVTVRAGYEPDVTVPGNFRRAMMVLIGAYDADREGGSIFQAAEGTARSLLRRYKAHTA